MRFSTVDIVLQEVPGEISLALGISGCPLRCDGCHSPYLRNGRHGTHLTTSIFLNLLEKYRGYISCVLFLGGEWHPVELVGFLEMARAFGLKTALYTGQEAVSEELVAQLTYLKTGEYKEALGGLSCETTNQRFTNVETGEILNHLFRQ